MTIETFFEVTVKLAILWYPVVIVSCVLVTMYTAKNFFDVVKNRKNEYLEPAFIIMVWPMIFSVIAKRLPFPRWNAVDSEVLWRYGVIINIMIICITICATIGFCIIRKVRR